MSFKNEPIAIIGSACRFPGGCDTPSKLWDLLQKPRDLLRSIPEDRFNIKAFYHPDPTHHGTTNVQTSYFLDQDVAQFDAKFFGIPPKEAESIDPQQRLLMETVYDGLCAAGLPMEQLRGSSTAVYIGQMCDDWSLMVQKDIDEIPTYTGTGSARSIMSNRVSYFFDWHGPSMTIDTACSSSLIAVHEAVRVLRSGDSRVAIAAGANLILSPGQYVAESNLRMLSPTGRCRMWDASADGYGRGEGIACVVLKTLTQAQKDGDYIECLIRETGVNQDGRTSGITMPNNIAQTSLIRDTYGKAGLDLSNPMDRPQFFHAHGTGTKAGDPQEAEAIHKAFFSSGGGGYDKLYVGSIKTVIGHTEGTAGLASLIGTSLALQNGIIPPNMHFKDLNPDVVPFYGPLEIPLSVRKWPTLAPCQVRRASVNSFGFGGTNAHAIIEAYTPLEVETRPSSTLCTPLVFSANSAASLETMLSRYLDYINDHPEANLRDLAWTLQHRRSTLPYRKAISGSAHDTIRARIGDVLSGSDANLGTRFPQKPKPRILAVFTGQGAQWPRMGARLLESSDFVRRTVSYLDDSLASLPESDRPQWTLHDELLAGGASSRVAEAAISQPLCTALQVILVDLLKAAGIRLHAAVGHSSGEIGAAYAAGLLSARDAIRVAYYRGAHARLAASPNGSQGAMAAIGASHEDAEKLCQRNELQGRVQIAAYNSSSSITLSGDEDAIEKAIEILNDKQVFARRLRVDTAYHSAHMKPCADPYLQSMGRCGVGKLDSCGSETPTWFSSVYKGSLMTADNLSNDYWVKNMVHPVLISSAVMTAVNEAQPFDVVIEIGPHAALKSPVLDSLAEMDAQAPYTGLLSRGKNDVEELSAAMGFLWSHLGAGTVNFDNFNQIFLNDRRGVLVADLPSYPFNHQHSYWAESRASRSRRQLKAPPHPLLGTPCVGTTTSTEAQWKNILRLSEVSWMQGHKLQGQIVFPATGYIVMAIEAIKTLVGRGRHIAQFSLSHVVLERAMVFNDENASIESVFSLRLRQSNTQCISADFTCFSAPQGEQSIVANARGLIDVTLGESLEDSLALSTHSKYYNLTEVDVQTFYEDLRQVGYEYSEPFRGIASVKRRLGFAHGTLIDQSSSYWEDQLLVHPGMLDTALQTVFAALSYPGDGRLWSVHVPVQIDSLEFNPHFALTETRKKSLIPWESTVMEDDKSALLKGDIQLFTKDRQHTLLQMGGISLKPFSPAQPQDDASIFSHFRYLPASADGELAVAGERHEDSEVQIVKDMERLSFFYIRQLSEMTVQDRKNALPHHQHLLNWADYVVDKVSRRDHPSVGKECLSDTLEEMTALSNRYCDQVDALLIESIGRHLPAVIKRKASILEHMRENDLLGRFYQEAHGLQAANMRLAKMTKQISHRYPRMKILEIGAGTGGSTKAVLPALGSAFSTYTYTDISSGFFEEAERNFTEYSSRMMFKTFDMKLTPADQGFVENSYDMVLTSNVLHVADDLDAMMSNVRRLLKPGGYLLTLEYATNEILRHGIIMGGLPGWWTGVNTGRPHGPMLPLEHWDSLLRKHQFSGIDTSTPIEDPIHEPYVWATQAIDDRVHLLRSPTISATDVFPEDLPPLVLVGGRSLATYRFVETILTSLSSRFSSLVRLPSVEALSQSPIPSDATVLSLAELDEPFMQNITSSKMDGLKTLWRQSRNILWVTKTARTEEPFSYMMFGLGRVVKYEQPHINLQLLDIDCLDSYTCELISESLLRHQLLDIWSRDASAENLLWSSEPEIFVEKKQVLLPRLYPSVMENLRANSIRRAIFHDVDAARTSVKLIEYGSSFGLEEVPPLRTARDDVVLPTMIRIRQSLLQFIKFGSSGSFMLCIGTKEEDPHSTVLAVTQVSESPAPIEPQCLISIPSSAEFGKLALLTVSAHIVTQQILSMVPKEGTILVNEPDDAIKTVLSKAAQKARVNINFMTCQAAREGPNWNYIHPALPTHLVKESIPPETSVFVNFEAENGPGTRVTQTISNCLPPYCMLANAATFFTNELYTRSGSDPFWLRDALQEAWKHVSTTSLPLDLAESIGLGDVPGRIPTEESLTFVDWTVPTVPVRLKPVSNDKLFRDDRTYLLLGLSGEVGQSICRWMARCGAGYIVLASRNPKVSSEFIQSVEETGATVRPLSLEITSRESLRRLLKDVKRTMPPIAGVANGAMSMDDIPFDKMSLHSMNKVLRPKVDGSKILDEIFYDTPLDFFIMFSSMTACIGNPGQSHYAAANMFMTALAFQRQKRGVVGSVIDLTSLIGIGYIARAGLGKEHFMSSGVSSVSEPDLHQIFAEAVKNGRANSHEIAEVVTGFGPIFAGQVSKERFRNDLKFCQLTFEHPASQEASSSGLIASVRAQLKDTKYLSQVQDILSKSFTTRMKKLLQIPSDQVLDESSTLIEQGVDSLIAIEIRTWFLRELDADIPVIKVLGGGSIADLINYSIEQIPVTILDTSKLSTEVKRNTVPVAPAAPEQSKHLNGDGLGNPQHDSIFSAGSPESQSSPASSIDTPMESDSVEAKSSMTESSMDTSWRDVITESSEEITEKMSFGQTRFWVLYHTLQDKTAFNMAISIRLSGPVQVEALSEAIRRVGDRHEAMRTRYFWSGENQDVPTQGILSRPLIKLESRRITQRVEAQIELEAMRDHVWDLNDWETMRFVLLSLSKTEHWLIVGNHHITLDGLGIQILLADLEKAYLGMQLPELPKESQYRHFAVQQRQAYETGRFQKEIEYFQKLIPNLVEPIELFSFANVNSRPPQTTYHTSCADIRLQSSDTAVIKQVARQSQSTNFHLYVAVLQVLLFRLLPDMDQTMIGIADANRASQQTMETLGFFLNVLPIRLDRPASDSTFRSLIKMVRNSVYGVLEHSALPFDVLLNELKIDRTGNAPPLFQVFVDYRIGTQERAKFANCKAQGEKWYNARTGYDVSLDILENSDGDTLLSLDLQQSLYTKEHAELLLRAYVNLLKAFTATPDVELAVEIPGIWAVEDISNALRVGTGPATSLEWPPTVAHRIDQMIYLHGPKSALKDDRGNNLTYNEMGSRVDAITRNLVKNGVCKGMTVGVMQEPSAYWVCSMLAIFRVGAIYLPLDLRNSVHRIRSTIRIAHPNILLADQTMVETAEIVKTAGMAVIDVSQVAANPAAEPTENLASSDSPAVVLFTSGSTSEPKGILIKHSNLIAQIESNSQQYNLADGGASMVLQQAAFSFDMSLDQIFNALTNGGCLFVVPAEKRGDPSEIAKLMVAEQVTYTLATPSEYHMWFHFAGEHLQKCSRWQYAFMGGEHIPRSLLQEIRAMNSPSLRFVNIYGPTETTITCTSKGYIPYQITDQQYPLPTGFPAPNYAIYIVDDQLKPLPIGVPGEIVVGGAGVSAGYLGMDTSTQEKFLPSPFAHLESNFMENKWLSIYRTGDCGFLQDNGALCVTGRIKGDTQVKLHGFRIELGEIESTLIKTAGGVLVHAFVIVKEQKAIKFLVAHAVFSSQQTDMDRQEFLDNLRTTLPVPDYMRPAIIVPLENIPLNAHSKTDRAAIRNIPLQMPSGGIHKSSIDRETTSMEASLEELWRRVLPKSYWHSITPDTNFFHVGGSSLLIVRLQRLIKDEFQAAPMVNELMNAGRLIDMASLIEKTLSPRIDWHAETTIPDSWANKFGTSTEPAPRSVDNGLRILLTGATGYVGWNLLPLLIRSSNISEIFCLVRFGTDTDSLAKSSDKISIFTGDLGMAGLGLSNARFDHLATETDVILHCGANRSFWDDYEPLRSVNVSSVKELARLALHRRIPLHFLTSGAARIYEDNLAVRLYEERKDSVHASGTPPDDGSDGYVASKWAAEHFLTNVSETFALPVVLHRFEPVPGLLCDPQLAEPETDDTLKQLIEITKGLGVRPAMNELNGWVDIVPSHTVVENICAIVLGEREDRSNSPGLVVRSHAAERRVNWSRFIQELKGNDELAELPSMPTLQWIGQAKRAGFGYFMSSHRLAVVGEAADDMVSRR